MPKTIVRTSLRSPNNHDEKNQAHVKCASVNIWATSLYGMSQTIVSSHNQSINHPHIVFLGFSVYCTNKKQERRQTGMNVTHQCWWVNRKESWTNKFVLNTFYILRASASDSSYWSLRTCIQHWVVIFTELLFFSKPQCILNNLYTTQKARTYKNWKRI